MPRYKADEAADDRDELNNLLARISDLGAEVVSVLWRPALDEQEEDFQGTVTVTKRPSGYLVTYRLAK